MRSWAGADGLRSRITTQVVACFFVDTTSPSGPLQAPVSPVVAAGYWGAPVAGRPLPPADDGHSLTQAGSWPHRCPVSKQVLPCRSQLDDAHPTIADAVLDRLVHAAHRIALDGETLRKPPEKSAKRGKLDTDTAE